MAIPSDIKSIYTNLPLNYLKAFLEALESGKCTQIPNSSSVFVGSRGANFTLEGNTYGLEESFELVTSVYLLKASPGFVNQITEELETELSIVVANQKFKKANKLKKQIKALKKLTPPKKG